MTEEIDWVSHTEPRWKHALKPCKYCGFCPYGQMVEIYPISAEKSQMSCEVFGHDCPSFYLAEPFAEEYGVRGEDEKKFLEELEERFR